MDEIDHANQYLQDVLSDMEKEIRGKIPQERQNIDEEVECSMCSEPVEIKRARLGYEICYSCSSWAEKSSKQYNRHKSYEYDD